MEDLPHQYQVEASADTDGSVTISSHGLPSLVTAPPAQFGGPGDQWSPETLLVAAVADCFILTFRAIARASKLVWRHLSCSTEGVLDRVDGELRFTELLIRARLQLPPGGDCDKGRRLLEKAEKSCLITNSLIAKSKLESQVDVDRTE
jgi:organic hydroperoxide reductase OsmC/OhrA